jgi:hypothetical protein
MNRQSPTRADTASAAAMMAMNICWEGRTCCCWRWLPDSDFLCARGLTGAPAMTEPAIVSYRMTPNHLETHSEGPQLLQTLQACNQILKPNYGRAHGPGSGSVITRQPRSSKRWIFSVKTWPCGLPDTPRRGSVFNFFLCVWYTIEGATIWNKPAQLYGPLSNPHRLSRCAGRFLEPHT